MTDRSLMHNDEEVRDLHRDPTGRNPLGTRPRLYEDSDPEETDDKDKSERAHELDDTEDERFPRF